MDTIIYFFRNRETDNFITEKWKEDDYCLIRAGVPPFVWKAARSRDGVCEQLKEKEMPRALDESKGMDKVRHWNGIKLLRKILPGYGGHNTISESRRASEEKRQDLENCIGEWQTALRLLADNPNQIACVYEDSLRRELEKEELRSLWCAYWNIPEFEDYREWRWGQKLMPHTIHDYYVIVGFSPYVPEILYTKVRQMRGVRWILPEEQYSQNVQDFLDDFYEETGLAVETELISTEFRMAESKTSEDGIAESYPPKHKETWARLYLTASQPVNVLDFSGEDKISACGVPRGSVWIDMDSQEEKCRRMEARNPGVLYFSLKKGWKQMKSPYFRAKSPRLP